MNTLCEFEKKQVDQDLHCSHKAKRKIFIDSDASQNFLGSVGRQNLFLS